jgi:hypothetical protein
MMKAFIFQLCWKKMLVEPILDHWNQGGKISRKTGQRLFFIPFRCLMDIPEKEKSVILSGFT